MCKARCWREYEGGTVWDTDCSVSHSFPPDPLEAFPRNLPERREKIKFTSLRSLLSFFGSFLSILCSSTPEEEKWKGLFQVSDSRAVVTRQLEIPSQFFFFFVPFFLFPVSPLECKNGQEFSPAGGITCRFKALPNPSFR